MIIWPMYISVCDGQLRFWTTLNWPIWASFCDRFIDQKLGQWLYMGVCVWFVGYEYSMKMIMANGE